jgi:hypothetical protein
MAGKMDGDHDSTKFPAELVFVSPGAVHSSPRIALIQGSETTAHAVERLGEQWKAA